MKRVLLLFVLVLVAACSKQDENPLDQFDPKAPDAPEKLEQMDEEYKKDTGESPFIPANPGKCYQMECPVFVYVNKESQKLYLYNRGELLGEWDVSTGAGGYETPNFDRRPNGRIYNAYTSKTFPGGNYNGLGNMPYAVFIEGGYAIHGTTVGNWKKLGQKASHGCIRIHPDNAEFLNSLVRQYGVSNTWILVN